MEKVFLVLKHLAEVLDALRVIPRLFLLVCLYGYMMFFMSSWEWYTSLDYKTIDVGKLGVITAYPTFLLTALGGLLMGVYKIYSGKAPYVVNPKLPEKENES